MHKKRKSEDETIAKYKKKRKRFIEKKCLGTLNCIEFALILQNEIKAIANPIKRIPFGNKTEYHCC